MKATKRDLVGRKIVAINWQPFNPNLGDSNRPNRATDPILTLDNGRKLWFVVQETEVGEYGIEICITERAQ